MGGTYLPDLNNDREQGDHRFPRVYTFGGTVSLGLWYRALLTPRRRESE
jgi:hypothetical protein